jgi:hypothetical protein
MQKLKRPDLSSRIESTLRSLLRPVVGSLKQLAVSGKVLKMAALIVIILMICVATSGCQPRTVRPSLPAQADPRPMPKFRGTTYRDALVHIPELREWGTACEADKAVIREMFSNE